MICEYCGAPIPAKEIREKAYRLKYHARCARTVNRERHTPVGDRQNKCDWCGGEFISKRSDAKFCSARCRTATHRIIQAARA